MKLILILGWRVGAMGVSAFTGDWVAGATVSISGAVAMIAKGVLLNAVNKHGGA